MSELYLIWQLIANAATLKQGFEFRQDVQDHLGCLVG
jgi:hypothetical protein